MGLTPGSVPYKIERLPKEAPKEEPVRVAPEKEKEPQREKVKA